ncbi:Uma2 family endonuclease [Streptacidiphilus carbonis]|jgi:Uma2 family endonuclease|uniref:Uma2 family endonuclease n=1 Tax=Streptacidiphilus carbonis TaxID=105422 RepID=UPI001F3AA1D8|nr:Uma2 family endonuclease [Streptacidiphilus carbonis]
MGAPMSVDPEISWPVPPRDGWTADDLDRLPNLPPHTELLDGSLVFMSPQTAFHDRAMLLLQLGLFRTAPEELDVRREMTVTLGPRNRPEPDLLVIKAEALTSSEQTSFVPGDVVLAVEVVSPDSEARDLDIKPVKYAKAGIAHFWRVENEGGLPVVHVFELEQATRSYVAMGIFREHLTLQVPFPIDIDLTAVNRRP